MNLVSCQDLTFTYQHQTQASIKDINLTVKQGETILICGASGSGKTSLTRIINGLAPNYLQGKLTGQAKTSHLVAGSAPIEAYVPLVATVFQNPKTQHFATNTTHELAFTLENLGKPADKIQWTIDHLCEIFSCQQLLDRNIFDLSGGEKQQVALLAATTTRPPLLILDEVTSNLDHAAIQKLRRLIQRIQAKGASLIILEHRLEWAVDLVDRFIYMEDGQITREWSKEEFTQLKDQSLHNLGLRSTNLSRQRQELQEKAKQSVTGDLQCQQLALGYSKKDPIIQSLDLSFNKGEITGLIGPNGVGKTTLAQTLTGLLKPLKGQIRYLGQKQSRHQLLNQAFLVMQDPNFQLFSETVKKEVLLQAKYPDQYHSVMKQLHLIEFEDRHPMTLSGGQKQRVAVASAVLSGKEIIIFDEPTSGLDYWNMQSMGQILQQLAQAGKIVIVITHDEELACEYCDRIVDFSSFE
ncbi:ABC transporter ATP-binding protein [Hutsoniella sourekii]|uniref:ABC transporter ATP-binding protein n=1 Tax=Hutsoniella sourekii TaxID=87650 RepID=UPI0004866D9A|nr:energy-coupling factor ABC transporter ATP-binding protein [Hutsoniella sourekii]